MSIYVTISLGNGSVREGFPSVIAQILDIDSRRPQKAKVTGSLPAFPPLIETLQLWQRYYIANSKSKLLRQIKVDPTEETLHFTLEEFYRLGEEIEKQLNDWLQSKDFQPIERQIRTYFSSKDQFQIAIESNDQQIWQLPWHLWQFYQDFPHCEVGIGSLKSVQVSPTVITRQLSRVLAILGDSHGINIEEDRHLLENLLGTEICFLIEPTRQQFNEALWDPLGWDILFFAGHSYTCIQRCSIVLNRQEELNIADLSYALKQAISKGLSLAIFNSCQGLGLVSQLAPLSIPHLIVMKEPVPDRVAQEFLKYFLEVFTKGTAFPLSLRIARQKLQGLEQECPFASWLPILYQNTCELPPTWSPQTRQERNTQTFTPAPTPAEVKIFNESVYVKTISLTEAETLIGRAEDCDIHLDRTSVSRHHAIIKRENNRYSITDLGSRMGTLVNGTPITPHTPCPLQHQDRIEISRYLLEVYLVPSAVPEPPPPAEGTVAYQFSPTEQENKISINFRNKSNLTIGRDPSNDVVLSHPAVSAFHGIVTRFDGSIYITDLNSRNGIFVNGKRVKGRKSLNYNDRVRIASYSLIFNEDQTFTSIDESGKIRIDAVDLCQVIDDANTRQKRNLLNHISVSILPREFVIIAGVSGGGKSTLMDALNGFRPASSGVVYFNGLNLYQNYDAYRSEIGYVPQQDIVHTDLTVYQALNFAARLRMPPDVRPQEREQRITQVLTELKLLERKNTKIARLSGGQKKRVSIALELLTEPSLFFLDEATSGLDPATDREVMQILRQIADSGKTVLLITHATENVKIADQVLFLAKGGNLAYFGPPSEIQKYFSTVAGETIDTFTDIYRVVEDQSKRSGEQWRAEFMQSSYYQKYVRQRQKQIDLHAPSHTSAKKTETAANTSLLSQFWILLQRNFLLLFSDRVSTVLVILVTPILGFLDTLTWDRNLFDVVLGNSGQAITMLFNMGLVAIIAGCLSTMREIIKEADIYKRERATGLKTSAYILSKLCFCIVLALYQSATLLACKYISVNLPGTLWQYYLIMFLSSLAGTILGLFVSSISPNQNVTPLLAIVLLIPQITFGGGVLPVRSLSGIGGIINQVTLTKWPFEALVTVSGIGKDVVQDQCWNLTKAEREQLTDVDKQEKCICLGENIFKYCQFPGILADYDAESIDKPEPVQPKRPASPGKIPSNPLEMPDYEKKVDKFNRDLESWEKNMQKWRSDFSKWKEKRESLIGSAEGIISQIRDDYGQGFAVNIWGHMRNMIIQICFLVVLIFYLQKRRDAL